MTKEDQKLSFNEHLPPSPETLISFAAIELNFKESPLVQGLRRKLIEEQDPGTYLLLLSQFHEACEEIVDANNDNNRLKRQIGSNLVRAAIRAERQAWGLYKEDISDILDEADMSGLSEIADSIADIASALLPQGNTPFEET